MEEQRSGQELQLHAFGIMKRMVAADREFYTVLSQIVEDQIQRLSTELQEQCQSNGKAPQMDQNQYFDPQQFFAMLGHPP